VEDVEPGGGRADVAVVDEVEDIAPLANGCDELDSGAVATGPWLVFD
jgi:hypothetical protein